MFTLEIIFHDGFNNDMVILKMDGEVIYHNDDVTTMKLIDMADSYQIEGLNTPLVLEIHMPMLDLVASVPIDLTKPFLYVNLIEGCIVTKFRDTRLFHG